MTQAFVSLLEIERALPSKHGQSQAPQYGRLMSGFDNVMFCTGPPKLSPK
jgi:hypothetical protein